MADKNIDINNLSKDLFQLVPADPSEQEKIGRPSLTFWKDAKKRLMANSAARFSIVVLAILILLSVFGPLISSHTFKEQIQPLASHAKLPPRVAVLEKLGIMDGSRVLKVGVNGLAAYKDGQYKILKEYIEYDRDLKQDVTKYKIKEFTYIKNHVDKEYYWFGTDELARDIWTRTWKGAQISLFIALVAAILDLFIGITYGSIAGYFGGKIDMVMMRIIEIVSGIPAMVIIILFMLVLPKGMLPIILAIGITEWVTMARVVRSQFLKLKNQEFVIAARTIGASDKRMIWKHFIPNVLGQVIIVITFTIPSAIFYEAFLAFIGLGIPAPNASLGVLISDGYKLMKTAPHLMIVPSIVICLMMLALNLFANGLRDALDPKMRNLD